MEKETKKRFINELIDNIRHDLLSKADRYPENWDGIELRWLIAEHFNSCIIRGMGGRKRKRDFNNELRVNNLI